MEGLNYHSCTLCYTFMYDFLSAVLIVVIISTRLTSWISWQKTWPRSRHSLICNSTDSRVHL